MGKIKVLQVTGSLRIGGVETVAMNILRYIDKEKYEVDFLVYGDKEGEYESEAKKLGAKILRAPLPRKGYIKFYKDIQSLLVKNGPYDIVHSHVLFNSGIVMKAAESLDIPRRISHAHDNLSHTSISWPKKIYNKIMRNWLLKYSTDFLACAKDAGDYLFSEYEFNRRGNVLNNGINVEKFAYSSLNREKIRKELRIEDKLVVGNIARLSEQKNQLFLLDVFKKVHQVNNQTVMLIVGEGELRKKLENKIKELKLEDNVIMTGSRTDIPELLSSMDIFVLPSIHEGLGIVLIEAQANGMPCIAPKNIVPDEAEILENFQFIELDANEDKWAQIILNNLDNQNRINKSIELIKSVGYDVKDIGDKIHIIYSYANFT